LQDEKYNLEDDMDGEEEEFLEEEIVTEKEGWW
jgi:hypothetical protein